MARNGRGNTRVLRAYLEQAVVMSDEGVRIVPVFVSHGASSDPIPTQFTSEGLLPLNTIVQNAERIPILKALKQCEGSVGKFADILGSTCKTLWKKMNRLAISA
jgi:DNA-binding NtrC family response regulator